MPPCVHSLWQPVVPAHQIGGRKCRGEPPPPPPQRHTIFTSLRLQQWFSWMASNLEVVSIKRDSDHLCFLRFFDRTSVSRDRDCYGLTKISEILGGHQIFGMRQRFDHFEHGGPVQTGQYSTGESLPIKAGHRELLRHLESTCTRFNTSARRRT